MHKPAGPLAFAAAVALVAAGCGGSSSSGSKATPTPAKKAASSGGGKASSGGGAASGGGKVLHVAADSGGALKFTQSSLTAKAGKVTVDFSNPASIPHAVTIEGHGVKASTKVVTNGSSSTTVRLKPGTYTFFCPVDSHRQAGMKGTLTVSG